MRCTDRMCQPPAKLRIVEMKTTIFVLLTICKAAALGYTGYQFFRHFRTDGKKALNYLGLFFLSVIGVTALEFGVAFILED